MYVWASFQAHCWQQNKRIQQGSPTCMRYSCSTPTHAHATSPTAHQTLSGITEYGMRAQSSRRRRSQCCAS
jgi:hypothetical protein